MVVWLNVARYSFHTICDVPCVCAPCGSSMAGYDYSIWYLCIFLALIEYVRCFTIFMRMLNGIPVMLLNLVYGVNGWKLYIQISLNSAKVYGQSWFLHRA